MFDKPLENLTIADIQQLVDVLKIHEGQNVDYKRELDTSNDAKKELIKDLTAFGNSNGGYLLIGIDEEDGLPTTITGTAKSVGRQKIDEWINSIISANSDPKLDYSIKVIPHKQDKVVVVIFVKDSPKKPHMNIYEKRNTYFRRHIDITSAASHQEVKDMFAESQSTQERLRNFMNSRGLLDVDMMEFALTHNARELLVDNKVPRPQDKQYCIFSLIPATIDDDLTDPVIGDANEWINSHTRGYQPITSQELYRTHEPVITIEGITFPNVIYDHDGPRGYRNYMEFLNNGYVEFGVARQLFGSVPDGRGGIRPLLHLTNTVAIAHALMNFANAYYPAINYDGQVYLQISLHNVKNHAITGFDTRIHNSQRWAGPYTLEFSNPPTLTSSLNVRILSLFKPDGTNNAEVNDMVYDIAMQLSRAFGTQQVKCFDEARTYDPDMLRALNL